MLEVHQGAQWFEKIAMFLSRKRIYAKCSIRYIDPMNRAERGFPRLGGINVHKE
jgi:hypothetical protein